MAGRSSGDGKLCRLRTWAARWCADALRGQGVVGSGSLELDGASTGVVPADVDGVVPSVDGVVVTIGWSGAGSGGGAGTGAVVPVVGAAALDWVRAAHVPMAPSIDTVTVEARLSPADAATPITDRADPSSAAAIRTMIAPRRTVRRRAEPFTA